MSTANSNTGGCSLTSVLAQWAAGLRYADLPDQIAAYATSQLISQLAAIRAGLAHPLGHKLVRAFGPPTADDPARAAQVLAALSACLYYEDSMYAGHVSHSTVNVPLAYRRVQRSTGRRLIASMVAANECAARVTAAAALGPLRGQGTSYTQLVGAVAARLHALGAPVQQWVDAWGLALGAPPWPLRRAFFGSDAKVLSAAAPIRTALDACDAAAAGLSGAADILEHPGGLLAKFCGVPLTDAVTMGLGSRWHTETLSFKVYPASANVDAAIDCAAELHYSLRQEELVQIDRIIVSAARLTMVMDRHVAPYLDRERSAIAALNHSVAYNVATALTTGSVVCADLAEPATADPVRWAIAAKVRLEYDQELSGNLLRATAPIGEALRQAGGRARDWLIDFSGGQAIPLRAAEGTPSRTFEEATKAVGARVRITLRDGRVFSASRSCGAGSAGAQTRRTHRLLARTKLLATGASAELTDALEQVASLDARELDDVVEAALTAPVRMELCADYLQGRPA